MTLTFRGPDRYLDPADMEEVLQLVREKGSDYWNTNSGDASLVWSGPGEERRLTLYFLGREGFHLVFRQPDGSRIAALPAKPPARPKWIDIPVGGNPKRIQLRSGGQPPRSRADPALLRRAWRTGPGTDLAARQVAGNALSPESKSPGNPRIPGALMVGVARIELATPAMSTQCSTTELHAHCAAM